MPVTIAITGLHRGENPQPGCGIIRALRKARSDLRIIGLVYGPYESGAYDATLADRVYTIPYPGAGREAFFQRLDEISEGESIDVFFPTLDSEIEPLTGVTNEWRNRNIRAVLPDEAAFRTRAKSRLPDLCKSIDCPHPKTTTVEDVSEIVPKAEEIGWPVFVKGKYYGARLAHDASSLLFYAFQLTSDWGLPLVLQQQIGGEEINVAGVGDGKGKSTGFVALRKCLVSSEGKGYGGVTISDPKLEQVSRSIIEGLKWNGPFELEFIRDRDGDFYLIEINPRFPAWIEFSAAVGCNLPAAALSAALGEDIPEMPRCPAGKFFIRHSIDLCGDVSDLGKLSTTGELIRHASFPSHLAVA